MKLGRRQSPALLALFSILLPCGSGLGPVNALTLDSSLLNARAAIDAVIEKAAPVGTKDAPVDGKDGMPHTGPFVETNAERSRKKIKDQGDEEPVIEPLSDYVKDRYKSSNPSSNEGVMDDPQRLGPAEGTRGTEGGVSAKSKDLNLADKVPDPPKEAPPLPHSELKTMQDTDGKITLAYEEDSKKLLELPEDLPAKPYDLPMPENPSSPKDTTIIPGKDPLLSKPVSGDESGVIQPLHSLLLSFTMIIFSEIGDKTFLIAALMAMRHDRIVVFTAAFSALITMTVLSALLGHALPTLIPKSITNFAAAGLFLVFGVKLLLEARKMSPDEGIGEEMKEVEMELEEKEHQQLRRSRRRSSITPYVLEAGRGVHKARLSNGRLPSPPESPSPSSSRGVSPTRHSSISNMITGCNNLLSLLLSPAWVQTFVMTFLGEWGDRSQIATIAMAAGQDYWWVTAGALVGHAMCTAAAVIGGKAIAGRVSLKAITGVGGVAFLVFGFIYTFEAIY